MAKNKLSSVGYKSLLKKAGKHSDGEGLILVVSKGKTGNMRASWTFVFQRDGRRTELGLGSAGLDEIGKGLTLSQARAERDRLQGQLQQGLDPRREREREKEAKAQQALAEAGIPTVQAVLRDVFESKRHKWRSAKHEADWDRSIETLGKFGAMKVDEVRPSDVASYLRRMWLETPSTADRFRARVAEAFDRAIAMEWRSAANPADKSLIEKILGPQKKSGAHHTALPFEEMPSFVAAIRERQETTISTAFCLEFIVLTAARAGEACGARWDEIDMDARVWSIPASRMKAGREHRVPLSKRALEILDRMKQHRRNNHVFPSVRNRAHVVPGGLIDLIIRMGWSEMTTVHGIRSSFRDWAGDKTSHAREVAEAALAHAVGDQSERAYRRGDALEKRRLLMEEWSAYLDNAPKESNSDNVIQFKKA